jgi:putative two-component system response regulator
MDEMQGRVLFVDDDLNVLEAMKRTFHGDGDIAVLTASNAHAAMQILKENCIPVIVSDHHMPGISGIEFLEWAKTEARDSMRILLTGSADFGVAVNSINRSEVYRFICKPWKAEELKATIRAALERHRMLTCLKSGDETTLLSLIRTIELKDPYIRGHSERVAGYASQIADALGASEEEKRDIRYGSLLHDCGKIGIPEAILNKPGRLNPEQRELLKQHSRWGGEIAITAGLHQRIVNIALHHHERFDGSGYPSGLAGFDIPMEARIVAVADVYDALASDRPYRKRLEHSRIIEFLLKERKTSFDPRLVDLLVAGLEQKRSDHDEDFDSRR